MKYPGITIHFLGIALSGIWIVNITLNLLWKQIEKKDRFTERSNSVLIIRNKTILTSSKNIKSFNFKSLSKTLNPIN
ncbi:hypothetical protein EV11_0403 [Prochlorococcus sp. SS52]|nr:hypothetical protein EV04_0444 [Prochlorococcus marinus str. LG]KGG19092.1 hypothetical protein EV08_1579 [Prochlorococcus marinus str. SS2]KGG23368.1 hypothetical protein EV09_0992 [Prochlorococcus marinus str. SS35]KGG32396.1 hypothetical protein EV10_1511 [Prochlorococcus marinus str. SS51]KGG36972.1 hypothetical protein EV11_0403 [Prochlorococcus sp. SS52]